jgi:4-hydroxybenzoate polyprenyltransferase
VSEPISARPAATPAPSFSKRLSIWLTALRPRQWTKNGLVFVGLVFSLNLTRPDAVLRTLLAFVVLCALASSAYLVNDAVDAPRLDRVQPVARRPIAAGLIAPTTALWVALGLVVGGLAVAAWLTPGFLLVGAGYLGLTVAYTLWLKHYPFVDLFTVAAGFVLRAAAGAVVLEVYISPWLLLCTLFGALFIVLAKRRHELATLEAGAAAHRGSLGAVTVQLLDELMLSMATCSIVGYSLYTILERPGQPPLLMLTIPFVMYGIFRYLYLVRVGGLGGSPEEALLTDRPLAGAVLLWAALSAAILYLGPR